MSTVRPYEIAKVKIDADDTILITTDLMLDKTQVAELQHRVKTYFPNNKVLIVSNGFKFSVVKQTQ